MKIRLLNLKTILKTICVVILLFFITAYPNISVKGASNGLRTFIMCVFPSIFPFMVISKYIIYSGKYGKIYKLIGKLFNISDECAEIVVLGSLSGYPTGASLINDQVKKKV